MNRVEHTRVGNSAIEVTEDIWSIVINGVLFEKRQNITTKNGIIEQGNIMFYVNGSPVRFWKYDEVENELQVIPFEN